MKYSTQLILLNQLLHKIGKIDMTNIIYIRGDAMSDAYLEGLIAGLFPGLYGWASSFNMGFLK